MPPVTPNTRVDALVRVIEDVAVVAGAAAGSYLSTHRGIDVASTVAAAPLVRSLLAGLLSKGRVSGLALAVKLVWQALDATTPAQPTAPVAVSDGALPPELA